jgi:hypothetical protein
MAPFFFHGKRFSIIHFGSFKLKQKKTEKPSTQLSFAWLAGSFLMSGMLHVTCTQGNRVDSRLLVVGSQTVSLTPDLPFGHNLCLRCPNGRCEPILDIYVEITFQ